jgi:hypothetical protein
MSGGSCTNRNEIFRQRLISSEMGGSPLALDFLLRLNFTFLKNAVRDSDNLISEGICIRRITGRKIEDHGKRYSEVVQP